MINRMIKLIILIIAIAFIIYTFIMANAQADALEKQDEIDEKIEQLKKDKREIMIRVKAIEIARKREKKHNP